MSTKLPLPRSSVVALPIRLEIWIRTACPWNIVNLFLTINHWLKWLSQCAPEGVQPPNPVQGYADHVQIASKIDDRPRHSCSGEESL